MQTVPVLAIGSDAVCVRCDALLERAHGDPLGLPLAMNLTGLVLLGVACTTDLMRVATAGIERTATLATGPASLGRDGLWELSVAVVYTTMAGPLVQLLGMSAVLLSIAWAGPGRTPPPAMRRVFAWVRTLRQWSMVEVYLVGVFVAYTKLRSLVSIEIGTALAALFALMLAMIVADATLDAEAVWTRLGGRPKPGDAAQAAGGVGCDTCGLVTAGETRCPRCGSALRRRKPDSLERTWALAISALVLYIPANLYPALTYIKLGSGAPSTILGGARELLEGGQWPLALLVFVASVAVPVLKLAALFLMLLTTGRRSRARLHDRTRLFRIVHVIGRWSMIDIFMESILVALVQFGGVVSILPGSGALAFASVVVLTMLASESFDPRLMWDAAEAPA